jgi:hypothetical protein
LTQIVRRGSRELIWITVSKSRLQTPRSPYWGAVGEARRLAGVFERQNGQDGAKISRADPHRGLDASKDGGLDETALSVTSLRRPVATARLRPGRRPSTP